MKSDRGARFSLIVVVVAVIAYALVQYTISPPISLLGIGLFAVVFSVVFCLIQKAMK